MEENEKSGYTAEDRKLRPRRPRISSMQNSSSNETAGDGNEKRSHESNEYYGSSNGYRQAYSSENKPYRIPRRSYGNDNLDDRRNGYDNNEHWSYASHDRRNYSQEVSSGRRDFNSGNQGERRNYKACGNRAYGNRNNDYSRGYNSGRNYNSDRRRSYNDYGENRSYGSGGDRSYGNSEGRGNSEDRAYGNNGERRSFNSPARRPYGNDGRNTRNQNRRSFDRNDSRRDSYGKGHGRTKHRQTTKPGPYSFGKSTEEGISRMLSTKPLVDQLQYSDNDNVPTQIQEEVRLNKYIANSGICSRREADQYIQAGVVSVNGVTVTELGTKVNVLKDEVKFNDETIHGERKVYIVMNKPKGFATTTSDSHADKTVMDLLKGCKTRVFPVGRLDKSTTGVLMFTNDGEIAEKLTHPSYDKKKIYQVILDHALAEEDLEKIKGGIELSDGPVKADELEYIDAEDHRKLGIEIHSGKNRIVRRIFESCGYDVKALDRVYFAGLTKKGLKKGEWRYLSEGEANVLKMGAYI